MQNVFTLLSSGSTEQAQGGGMSIWVIILMYAVIIGGMYLILIRPSSKRKKKEEALRKSAQIGDDITTIGGVVGRIVSIKDDDTLIVETGADRAKMRIKRWAISSVDTIHDDAD